MGGKASEEGMGEGEGEREKENKGEGEKGGEKKERSITMVSDHVLLLDTGS